MSWFKKLFSFFCLFAVTISLLCSCSKPSETVIKVGDTEYSADETVLVLDDYDISLEFYRYCYLAVKNALQTNDPDIDWSTEENRKTLSDETMGQVKYLCSVMKLAEKYGYELSEENLAEIDSTMKGTFESAGGATEYKLLLEENFLTHDMYQQALEINYLNSLMADSLFGTDAQTNKVTFTSDEAVEKYSENHYRLMSIYFPIEYLDEQGNRIEDEEYNKRNAAEKSKADAALKEIHGGASFAEVMKKYMGEEEYKADLQSYYDIDSISNSLGVDISGLKVGQTSAVIFAQECYFIIHRLENDAEYIKENATSVEATYAEDLLAQTLENISAEFKITETELYGKITPDTFS